MQELPILLIRRTNISQLHLHPPLTLQTQLQKDYSFSFDVAIVILKML